MDSKIVKGCTKLYATDRMDRDEIIYMWKCVCQSEFAGSMRTIRNRSKRGTGPAHCGCLTESRQSERNSGRVPANKLSDREATVNHVLRSSTSSHGSTLTSEDVDALVFSDCHYCGSAPSHFRPLGTGKWQRVSSIPSNGIDRKDSSVGYHLYNCVPCCSTCNYMKRDIPYMIFINHIHRMNTNGRWVGGNNV